jgi:hypothetical protein
MKRFIAKILLFFFLFLMANVLYLKIVQRYDWNYKKVLEARTLEERNFETIILGNSLAMDGINTEILGNAYNLSIGGATLATSEKQLEDYLRDAKSFPTTVILGMATCIEEDYSKESINPIIRYIESNKYDSFYDLPMIRFKWMSKVLIKRIFSKPHRNATIVQGQLRIARKLEDRSEASENPPTSIDTGYYDNLNRLQSIAQICSTNKIQLLVLEMPGIKKEQNQIAIGPHVMDNFLLYNFNNKPFCEIFDPKEHWLGGSHLNTRGAEVFTKAMKEMIFNSK